MENSAVLLAGGTGTRLNSGTTPKQYLLIQGKPIFLYSVEVLEKCKYIDAIFIVAGGEWQKDISGYLNKARIQKFAGFATPGDTRQLSILSGLTEVQRQLPDTKNVLIHDAARPMVDTELISLCMKELKEYEGVMPVLPLKDTCYLSRDGEFVTQLLDRNLLYAGQAPEGFHFGRYLEAHLNCGKERLKTISGSSELAFQAGMRIKLIPGSEQNFKITTMEDLRKFQDLVSGQAGKLQ